MLKGNRGEAARGLTDLKICVAVTVGILVGVVVSLWQQRTSTGLGGDPETLSLNAEREDLTSRLESVREENRRLEEQLHALQGGAEGGGAVVAREPLDPFELVQPGPAGTVTAPRTYPAVEPDRSANPTLARILDSVAVGGGIAGSGFLSSTKHAAAPEVLVAVANGGVAELLQKWLERVKALGIRNTVVVALDDKVDAMCREQGVAVWRTDDVVAAAGRGEETEGLGGEGGEASGPAGVGAEGEAGGSRIALLRDFLVLGHAVLVSDVDVVLLKNPFDGDTLRRDSDVEAMTDGFDNATAYGYNDVTDDPSMGWARYAHTMRMFVLDTGFFYLRPTVPAIELVDRVAARVARGDVQPGWDIVVFNEELWKPSHPGYVGLYASRRVLDYFSFLNSKVLFKQVRKEWRFAQHVPVAVHVNYHPDKYARVLAIIQYYVNKQRDALEPFPDGDDTQPPTRNVGSVKAMQASADSQAQ